MLAPVRKFDNLFKRYAAMSEKVFPVNNVDLQGLATDLKAWFTENGYEVQSADKENVHVFQARKKSGFSTLLDASPAFNVRIEGTTGEYTVDVGTGKWMESVPSADLTQMLTGGLTWLAPASSAEWAIKLEGEVWNWFGQRNV
jgi:hypothetical protein